MYYWQKRASFQNFDWIIMFSSNKFEVFSLLKNGSKYKLINFNIDKKHEIENNELNKKTFKNKIKKTNKKNNYKTKM